MATQLLPLPGEIVKKSNAIARAKWQPESKWEPRIVALVASKVREDDEDFLTYRIPVKELTGVSDEKLSGEQYREIAESITRLGKSTIRIAGKNPRNFIQYTIFAKCGYEDGYLIAGFHPDLKPHFLHLKSKFTEYGLIQYLSLPSIYSQRIFEFLKSWSSEQEITVNVVELHELLNSPGSFIKDFRQFRTRVLEKAHKDITGKTTLRYEWEAIKKGRSYDIVRFIFSHKLIALTEAKNKIADTRKIANTNNKIFNQALSCAEKKGGKCAKQDNTKRTCEVCMSSNMCCSIIKKQKI
jgi:plasmid replication initiation protein